VTATARRKAPPISETAEHLTIANYLRKIGLGGHAVAFHIRGERAGHWQRLQAARMGSVAKLPDWCIVDGGRVGFCELKPRGWKARRAKSGAYTEHERRQLDMHARLQRAGAWVEIVETLDEMLNVLAMRGVPLRTESESAERIKRGFRAAMGEALP
jgi:hypothetical protein